MRAVVVVVIGLLLYEKHNIVPKWLRTEAQNQEIKQEPTEGYSAAKETSEMVKRLPVTTDPVAFCCQ